MSERSPIPPGTYGYLLIGSREIDGREVEATATTSMFVARDTIAAWQERGLWVELHGLRHSGFPQQLPVSVFTLWLDATVSAATT